MSSLVAGHVTAKRGSSMKYILAVMAFIFLLYRSQLAEAKLVFDDELEDPPVENSQPVEQDDAPEITPIQDNSNDEVSTLEGRLSVAQNSVRELNEKLAHAKRLKAKQAELKLMSVYIEAKLLDYKMEMDKQVYSDDLANRLHNARLAYESVMVRRDE